MVREVLESMLIIWALEGAELYPYFSAFLCTLGHCLSDHLWFSPSPRLCGALWTSDSSPGNRLPSHFLPSICPKTLFTEFLPVFCCLTRPISWWFYLSIPISSNNLHSSWDLESNIGRGSFFNTIWPSFWEHSRRVWGQSTPFRKE